MCAGTELEALEKAAADIGAEALAACGAPDLGHQLRRLRQVIDRL